MNVLVLLLNAIKVALNNNHHKALRLYGKIFLTTKPSMGIEKEFTLVGSNSMLHAVNQFLHLHRPRQALHYSYELLEMLDLWPDLVGNTLSQKWLLYHMIASCYTKLGHLRQTLKCYDVAENLSGGNDFSEMDLFRNWIYFK